jgi:hypothetical protein
MTPGLGSTSESREFRQAFDNPCDVLGVATTATRARLPAVDGEEFWTLMESARTAAEPTITTKDDGEDAGEPMTASATSRQVSPHSAATGINRS